MYTTSDVVTTSISKIHNPTQKTPSPDVINDLVANTINIYIF